jgi:hypothetical protein
MKLKTPHVKTIGQNTMIGWPRLHSLNDSLDEVIANNIEGDFVECGVWRGGCSALMLSKIIDSKLDKLVWLYDTFQGMSQPTDQDIHMNGYHAVDEFNKLQSGGGFSNWCIASTHEVKLTLGKITTDFEKYSRLIVGKVEDTLKVNSYVPKKISLLRLDTDWYESTKIEFDVLYPLVSKGGIIIVDDYSDWQGSRKATDEYLSSIDNQKFSTHTANGTLVIKKK